jgi:hypothetical protein
MRELQMLEDLYGIQTMKFDINRVLAHNKIFTEKFDFSFAVVDKNDFP